MTILRILKSDELRAGDFRAYGTSEGVRKSWLKRKRAQPKPLGEREVTTQGSLDIVQKYKKIDELAKEAATFFGFDPAKLRVLVEEGHVFEVGGSRYKAAGTYDPEGQGITLYARTIQSLESVKPIVAHEVNHFFFDRANKVLQAEAELIKELSEKAVTRSPDGTVHYGGPNDPLQFNGFLKPEWLKKFPAHAAYGKFGGHFSPYFDYKGSLTNLWKQMEKEDGVSDYSRAYWKQYEDGGRYTHDYLRAVDETLAEIARNESEGVRLLAPASKLRPALSGYYKAVRRAYRVSQPKPHRSRKLSAEAVQPDSIMEFAEGLYEFHYPNGMTVFGVKERQ